MNERRLVFSHRPFAGVSVLGIDQGWSPRNATGVALGKVDGHGVRITHVALVKWRQLI